MRYSLLLAIPAVAIAGLAVADDNQTAGRYKLTQTGDAYIRLDTQTGQVSTCTGAIAALVCRSSPDERMTMQAEIDRLTKENDALKKANEDLKSAAVTQPSSDASSSLTIPSNQDVDKAFGFLDRVIKRLKGLVDELRKDQSDTTPL